MPPKPSGDTSDQSWSAKIVGVVHNVDDAKLESAHEHVKEALAALDKKSKGVHKPRARISANSHDVIIADEDSEVPFFRVAIADIRNVAVDPKDKHMLTLALPCLGHSDSRLAVHGDISSQGTTDVVVIKIEESASVVQKWMRTRFLSVPMSVGSSTSINSNVSHNSTASHDSSSPSASTSQLPLIPANIQEATSEPQEPVVSPQQEAPIPIPSPSAEWSCPKCTLINNDSLTCCDACGTPKPVPATGQPDTLDWFESEAIENDNHQTTNVRQRKRQQQREEEQRQQRQREQIQARQREQQQQREQREQREQQQQQQQQQQQPRAARIVPRALSPAVLFLSVVVQILILALVYVSSSRKVNASYWTPSKPRVIQQEDDEEQPFIFTTATYSDLFYAVVFPTRSSSSHQSFTSFAFSLLSAWVEEHSGPETFVGKHKVLVSVAAVALSISFMSLASSLLPALRKVLNYLAENLKVVGLILYLAAAVIAIDDGYHAVTSPGFAYMRGAIALNIANLFLNLFFNGLDTMTAKRYHIVIASFQVFIRVPVHYIRDLALMQFYLDMETDPVGSQFPKLRSLFLYFAVIPACATTLRSLQRQILFLLRFDIWKILTPEFLFYFVILAYRVIEHSRGSLASVDNIAITVVVCHFLFSISSLSASAPVFLTNPAILGGFILAVRGDCSTVAQLFWTTILCIPLVFCGFFRMDRIDAEARGRNIPVDASRKQLTFFHLLAASLYWTRATVAFFLLHDGFSGGILHFLAQSALLAVVAFVDIVVVINACLVFDRAIIERCAAFLRLYQGDFEGSISFLFASGFAALARFAPLPFAVLSALTSLNLFVFSIEKFARTHHIDSLKTVYERLWNQQVTLLRFLYTNSRSLMRLSRPVICLGAAYLFIDAFIHQPKFSFVGIGFILSAYTSIIIGLKLAAEITQYEPLAQFATDLYRNLDFKSWTVTMKALEWIVDRIRNGQILVILLGYLRFPLEWLSRSLAVLLPPIGRAIWAVLRFLWYHPTFSSLLTLAILTGVYLADENGIALPIPTLSGTMVILRTSYTQFLSIFSNLGSSIRGLAPSVVDFFVEAIVYMYSEVFSWGAIMFDATIPTYHILKSASFAWAFYWFNVCLGRSRGDEVLRLKIFIVPCFVIYAAIMTIPNWLVSVVFLLVVWVIIAVTMDLRRHEERRRVAAEVARQRQQGRLPQQQPLTQSKPPKIFENTQCIICFEDFTAAELSAAKEAVAAPPAAAETTGDQAQAQAKDAQSVFTTYCGHQFHRGCLQSWTNASHENKCPVCRQEITPTNAAIALMTIF